MCFEGVGLPSHDERVSFSVDSKSCGSQKSRMMIVTIAATTEKQAPSIAMVRLLRL